MPKLRQSVAPIWNHFYKCDNVNKKAICKYCKNTYSYKSTITNLKFHLRQRHIRVYEEFCRQNPAPVSSISPTNINDDPIKIENSNDPTSPYLGYFTKDEENARCCICEVTMPAQNSTLMQHLRRKHPKLLVDQKSDSDAENVQNEEEEVYTELSYLDEEEEPAKPPRANKRISFLNSKMKDKPKKLNKTLAELRRRIHSSSSEDEVPVPKLKKKNKSLPTDGKDADDEIEQFGKYIIHLIRTVPKHACTKLQLDIINLIMNTKLNAQQQNSNNLVFNIQSVQSLSNSDHVPAISGDSAVITVPSSSTLLNTESSSSGRAQNNVTVTKAVDQDVYTISTLDSANE